VIIRLRISHLKVSNNENNLWMASITIPGMDMVNYLNARSRKPSTYLGL